MEFCPVSIVINVSEIEGERARGREREGKVRGNHRQFFTECREESGRRRKYRANKNNTSACTDLRASVINASLFIEHLSSRTSETLTLAAGNDLQNQSDSHPDRVLCRALHVFV